MYENVTKPDKKRKDVPLVLIVAAALLVMAAAAAPIAWTFSYRHGFETFTNDLKCSIIHGKHFTCNISPEGLDALYRLICSAGPGKIQNEIPDGESFTVDFGDGSSIEFVKTEIQDKSSLNDYGTFVVYIARDGRLYAYDTDKLNYGILIRSITEAAETEE